MWIAIGLLSLLVLALFYDVLLLNKRINKLCDAMDVLIDCVELIDKEIDSWK